MFAFVRYSRVAQFNITLNPEKNLDDREEQHFNEIVITWNSQKLGRALWKTKKFYDSHTVASERDTCVGKAAAYVNKLYSCKYLVDEEFWGVIAQLTQVEFSQEYQSYGVRFEYSKGIETRIGSDRRKNPRNIIHISEKSEKGAVRVPVEKGPDHDDFTDLKQRIAAMSRLRDLDARVLEGTSEWITKGSSLGSETDASGND